jgi:cAMP phosphodiesterase
MNDLQDPKYWRETAHELRLSALRVIAYIKKHPKQDHTRRYAIVKDLREQAKEQMKNAKIIEKGGSVTILGIKL